jgi:hypothetical protein
MPGIGVLESSVEWPRATSKSAANPGFDGILASADDSSFCSSAEGLQTFRTFTFTGGCWFGAGGWAKANAAVPKAIVAIRNL